MKQESTNYKVHEEGGDGGVLFGGASVGWGGGLERAGSGLGEGLQRHFHSGSKESEGTEVEVALKEVGRQGRTAETCWGRRDE